MRVTELWHAPNKHVMAMHGQNGSKAGIFSTEARWKWIYGAPSKYTVLADEGESRGMSNWGYCLQHRIWVTLDAKRTFKLATECGTFAVIDTVTHCDCMGLMSLRSLLCAEIQSLI